jgi:hypothetical protein
MPADFRCRFSLQIFPWNDSRLNFEGIPDLEGFKLSFDGFELTPSFALDTTGASLI